MNVLLISPAGSNLYAKLGAQLPPLGLGYIASVIREHDHKAKIIDLGIDEMSLTQTDIDWADIIGISADTPRYPEALRIAKLIKTHNKQVVMGGYHVSFLDREALETGLVDYVVRGEGEMIFLNLLKTLENHDDMKLVAGISYLENGVYQKNRDEAPPHDLDNMPFPARDLLPIKHYKNQLNGLPLANLITSRGCPFNCYFCSSSKFGGLTWRSRSAVSIVDEMEYLYYTYGYRAFAFMDDNFTLSSRRIFEFADELEKRNLTDIYWWCFSRVDILVKNEDMVKRMAEAGAYMVFLGLESNNETVLNTYNKHIHNNQQQQAIKLLRKYGIKIHGSYIIGDIHETREMVLQTIKWAKQVNAKSTQFSILTPYPGTALYEDVEKDKRFLHKKWELYDGMHPVIKLDYLTPKEIQHFFIKAFQSFYLNPKKLFHHSPDKINGKKIPEKSLTEKVRSIIRPLSVFMTFRREINHYDYKNIKLKDR